MSDRYAVGICPEHGPVAADAVLWNFPNPATCAYCGDELEQAQMATKQEIKQSAHEFDVGFDQ
jgi:hypothetical protein